MPGAGLDTSDTGMSKNRESCSFKDLRLIGTWRLFKQSYKEMYIITS